MGVSDSKESDMGQGSLLCKSQATRNKLQRQRVHRKLLDVFQTNASKYQTSTKLSLQMASRVRAKLTQTMKSEIHTSLRLVQLFQATPNKIESLGSTLKLSCFRNDSRKPCFKIFNKWAHQALKHTSKPHQGKATLPFVLTHNQLVLNLCKLIGIPIVATRSPFKRARWKKKQSRQGRI